MSPVSDLVTVAHGTRFGPGNAVAAAVTERAATMLGTPGTTSYVELCAPSFASVMATAMGPSVVVPLLLSTGHHVRVDLPAAAALSRHEVVLAPALGPHPLLAAAQATRLRAAGAQPGQPVVLVAAGSTDPAVDLDLERAADLLAETWAARWSSPRCPVGDPDRPTSYAAGTSCRRTSSRPATSPTAPARSPSPPVPPSSRT